MTSLSFRVLAQAATNSDSYTLLPSGWIVMILSVGFVTGLLAWCILRVLRESRATKVTAPLDIQPPDVKQD